MEAIRTRPCRAALDEGVPDVDDAGRQLQPRIKLTLRASPGVSEGSCREQRRKRMDICEHMEVVDANGQHVGIVDKVDGDRIELTKKDALDPQHLFLDKSQVAGVEGNKVKLSQKVSAITTRAFLSQDS
jgi:hypothetical protein